MDRLRARDRDLLGPAPPGRGAGQRAARGAGLPLPASAVGSRSGGALAARGPARRGPGRQRLPPGVLDGDNDYAEMRSSGVAHRGPGALRPARGDDRSVPRHPRAWGTGATMLRPLPDGVRLALPDATVLDLSPQTSLLDDGAGRTPSRRDGRRGSNGTARHRAVVTKFGEARLAGSRALVQEPPASVATGTTSGRPDPWSSLHRGTARVSADGSGILARRPHRGGWRADVTARANGGIRRRPARSWPRPCRAVEHRITAADHRAEGVPAGVRPRRFRTGMAGDPRRPRPLIRAARDGPGHAGGAAESVLEQRRNRSFAKSRSTTTRTAPDRARLAPLPHRQGGTPLAGHDQQRHGGRSRSPAYENR